MGPGPTGHLPPAHKFRPSELVMATVPESLSNAGRVSDSQAHPGKGQGGHGHWLHTRAGWQQAGWCLLGSLATDHLSWLVPRPLSGVSMGQAVWPLQCPQPLWLGSRSRPRRQASGCYILEVLKDRTLTGPSPRDCAAKATSGQKARFPALGSAVLSWGQHWAARAGRMIRKGHPAPELPGPCPLPPLQWAPGGGPAP